VVLEGVPAALEGATVADSPAAREAGAGVTLSEDVVEVGGSGAPGAFSTRVSRSEHPAKSAPTTNVAASTFSFRFIITVSFFRGECYTNVILKHAAPVINYGHELAISSPARSSAGILPRMLRTWVSRSGDMA
jgi:hypothetical protein